MEERLCIGLINVDISNVWGQIALPDLLAMEKEVAQSEAMLENADITAPVTGRITGIHENGYDMEKSINRHFFSFKEWIIKSILLPITAKTLSAHEDFKEYAAYSPLYEYTKKIGEIYKQKLETHIF